MLRDNPLIMGWLQACPFLRGSAYARQQRRLKLHPQVSCSCGTCVLTGLLARQ